MDGIVSPRLRFRKFVALFVGAALACLAPSAAHAAATVFATAIERFAPLAPVTAERALVYRITFNTAVTGVDASDFTATTTVGNGAGTVSSVLGTGAVRYVRVAVPSPGGEFRLDLKAAGTGIVDSSGNTLGAGFTAGQTYISVVTTVSAAWGRNDQGQLGLGGVTARTPTALDSAYTFAQVAGGANQSLGVNSTGAAYAWGFDNFVTSYTTPVAVPTSGVLSGRTIIAAASGGQHNVVLSDTGLLFAWGRNEYGQLGDASLANSSTPIAVPATGALAGRTVMGISAGQSHTLALSADGLVFSWGRNNYGQLGNNSTTASNIPVALSGSGALAGRQIVAISAGENHCLALSADGLVFAWGLNEYGQLGDNSTTQRNVPVAVSTSGALAGKRIVAIAAGSGHSLALSADGLLFAWGDNFYGQLGNNSTEPSLVPVPVLQSGALSGRQAIAIAAGKSFNLVLTADRQVVTWGNNTFGQLGNGSTDYSQVPLLASASTFLGNRTPLALSQQSSGNHAFLIAGPTPATITSFAVPASATYRPGQILSFTVNFSRNVYVNPAAPPQFELLIGTQTVLATCTGGDGTASLTFGYTVLAGQGDSDGISLGRLLGTVLGSNAAPAYVGYTPPATAGILVDGIAPTATVIRRYSPAASPTTSRTLVFRVSFSEPVTGVDATDFTLRTGAFPYTISNTTGAIASVAGSDTEWYVTITSVTGLGAVELRIKTSGTGIQDTNGNALAASYPLSEWFGHRDQAVALSWGNNGGALGNGSFDGNRNAPGLVDTTGVLAGRSVAAISAGNDCSAALDSEGKLYSWGWNFYGNLGNGTTTDTPWPGAAATGGAGTGKSFLAVRIGEHTLALTTEGRVLTWGDNEEGQLGDGTTAPIRSNPVAVLGLPTGSPIVAIAAGFQHSLALTADGRIYAWGNNSSGQLGNNTDDNSPTPVLVQGELTGQHIVAIEAGDEFSLALTADGHVYAWGNNGFGQLGDGTTANRFSPVLVSGGALAGLTVRAITAGLEHAIAITSTGQCIGWGNNGSAQLGDNTRTIRLVPTAVSTSGVLNGKIVSQIATGYEFSYALSIGSGELYAWGANGQGQLGNGTYNGSNFPVQLGSTGELFHRRPIALSTSYSYAHSLAVASDLTRCVSVAQPAAAHYPAGAVLDFVLTFDHPVNVWATARPRLWLGSGYYAEFVPGGTANTSQLLFRHTVAAGENLPAGVNLGNDLDLNGTTINDGSGWSIDLALPAGLDSSGIVIDTTAPFAAGILRYTPVEALTPASTFVYRIEFNEPVTGVDLGDFTVARTPAGAAVQLLSLAGSGREYYLTLSRSTAVSQLRLDLNASGTGIADLAGHPITGGALGASYTPFSTQHYFAPVAWGANNSGQLGNGGGENASAPVPVCTTGPLADLRLVTLAPGAHMSVTTAADGRIFAWSSNPAFGLGDGTPVAFATTGPLASESIIATSAGQYHCLALTATGRVFAIGNNNRGQLGNGTNTPSMVPVEVDRTGAMAGEHIVAIAAGSAHSLALAASGRIYAWGWNGGGQLGDGRPNTDPFTESNRPQLVVTGALPAESTVIRIATGNSHCVALCTNGRVYSWGSGYLGATNGYLTTRAPIEVDRSTGLDTGSVTAIGAGSEFTLALTSTGRLFVWGMNSRGEVAVDPAVAGFVALPTRIDQLGPLAGQTIVAIAAGAQHSLALTSGGQAYAWGDNQYGQLGAGSTAALSPTPWPVDTTGTLAGHPLTAILSGSSSNHTLALVHNDQSFSRLETWRGRYFGSSANTGPGADLSDPDSDNRVNLLEYATATNPLVHNPGSPVRPVPGGLGADYFELTFDRIADPDLVYDINVSSTLAPNSWESIWFSEGAENSAGPVTVTDLDPISAHPRRFFRLTVIRQLWSP